MTHPILRQQPGLRRYAGRAPERRALRQFETELAAMCETISRNRVRAADGLRVVGEAGPLIEAAGVLPPDATQVRGA